MGKTSLPCAKNGSKPYLTLQGFFCIVLANNYFRQIAELLVTQNNFRTRISAELVGGITTLTQLFHSLLCSLTVKDATLTALAVVQRQPLFHECANLGLLLVRHTVVSQCTLWVLVPPRTALGVTHTLVCQIGQRDECRTTHTTHNHNFCYLANNVMAFH